MVTFYTTVNLRKTLLKHLLISVNLLIINQKMYLFTLFNIPELTMNERCIYCIKCIACFNGS